jgi:hypothetical protein
MATMSGFTSVIGTANFSVIIETVADPIGDYFLIDPNITTAPSFLTSLDSSKNLSTNISEYTITLPDIQIGTNDLYSVDYIFG